MFMKKVISFIKKERKFFISIAILMLGNMFLYWFIKLFQSNPIYINHYLDDKIPFWGWLVYVYNMFYPFCFIAFYLLYKKDEKAYFKGIISCFIGVIICVIVYLFIPTIMYRPVTPDYDPLTNLVLKITFYFDNPPLNCFPSLHCVFCFQVIFSYIISKCKLGRKTWIIICSSLIIISTLFVKQHYIYDIISALIVCIMANSIESILGIYNWFKTKRIV